uniref:Rps24 n=1 Tax=Arundo donax TaxID=35708 RepID=A0A0A9H9G6_ARUDO
MLDAVCLPVACGVSFAGASSRGRFAAAVRGGGGAQITQS